jgi:hypothetical protein
MNYKIGTGLLGLPEIALKSALYHTNNQICACQNGFTLSCMSLHSLLLP